MSAAHSRIRLDLNSPEFQEVLFRLEATQLQQVIASLRRLSELEWSTLYRHTGFYWEAIEHLKAPNGAKVYSLHLSQRIRALAFRDGEFLRFLSLHPDHDSAYERLVPRSLQLKGVRDGGPGIGHGIQRLKSPRLCPEFWPDSDSFLFLFRALVPLNCI